MKAVAIVILFPLMSVLIVSLFVRGGASRTASVVLLALSLIGVLAGIWLNRRSTGTH
jgi:hypothetical protein